MTVFTTLILDRNQNTEVEYLKEILREMIPNKTKVWDRWRAVVADRIASGQMLDFVESDWKRRELDDTQQELLKSLLGDAQAAFTVFRYVKQDFTQPHRRNTTSSAASSGSGLEDKDTKYEAVLRLLKQIVDEKSGPQNESSSFKTDKMTLMTEVKGTQRIEIEISAAIPPATGKAENLRPIPELHSEEVHLSPHVVAAERASESREWPTQLRRPGLIRRLWDAL